MFIEYNIRLIVPTLWNWYFIPFNAVKKYRTPLHAYFRQGERYSARLQFCSGKGLHVAWYYCTWLFRLTSIPTLLMKIIWIYYRPKKKLGLSAKEERTEANNTWTPADLVLRNNQLARRWICSVSNRMLQDTNTTNNLWFKKIWLPSPQKIKCPKIKIHTSGVKQSTCTCKITKGRFLGNLGGKGLRKRDSLLEALPWWVKLPGIRQSKITWH